MEPFETSERLHLLFINHSGDLSAVADYLEHSREWTSMKALALTQIQNWKKEAHVRIPAIFVDLDDISNSTTVNNWSLKAWRNTFNDLVFRCLSENNEAPTLVAFTREPSWEKATLAVKIGARDLIRLSQLPERMKEDYKIDITTDVELNNVVQLKQKQNDESKKQPERMEKIPHYAIPFPIRGLEGESKPIEKVRELIRRSAPLNTSVLIYGETGTGKELVSRAIHSYSLRTEGPLIIVNCGAIAKDLFEAELFGYKKGAFTGAHQDKEGLIQRAHGGTLVLDEPSQIPLEFQAKLLRAIQDRQVKPLGANEHETVDFRLISTTNEDLDELVRKGEFREDLLYRLQVLEIRLPRLAERRIDMSTLCQNILKRLARENKKKHLELSTEVLEKLLVYNWPGNIRELENAMEHASTLCWSENRLDIEMRDLPAPLQYAALEEHSKLSLKDAVRRYERDFIAKTIERMGGSKEEAAESLGLSLATLYRKLGT